MKKESIPVMFRVSRNDAREVFALFPTLPGTNERHTCTSYQHVGQHSSADLNGCIAASRPALPQECDNLLTELTQIYDDCELKIVTRTTQAMNRIRYAALVRHV